MSNTVDWRLHYDFKPDEFETLRQLAYRLGVSIDHLCDTFQENEILVLDALIVLASREVRMAALGIKKDKESEDE